MRRFYAAVMLLTFCLLLSGCSQKRGQEKAIRDQAIALMEDGAYGAAVAKFDEALTYHKGKVGDIEIDILKYRAEAEMRMDDFAAAEYTYRLLMEHDGKKPVYMNLRAICLVKSGGDMDKAWEFYNKAEEQDPDSLCHEEALCVLNNRMGMQCLDNEDYDGALGYFEQVLAGLQPETKAEDGKDEETEEGTEDAGALLHSPFVRDLKFNIAVCHEYKGEYAEALKLFKEIEKEYGSDEALEHEVLFLERK